MSSLSNDEAVKRQLVVTTVINCLETARVTEGMEAGDDSPHISFKKKKKA